MDLVRLSGSPGRLHDGEDSACSSDEAPLCDEAFYRTALRELDEEAMLLEERLYSTRQRLMCRSLPSSSPVVAADDPALITGSSGAASVRTATAEERVSVQQLVKLERQCAMVSQALVKAAKLQAQAEAAVQAAATNGNSTVSGADEELLIGGATGVDAAAAVDDILALRAEGVRLGEMQRIEEEEFRRRAEKLERRAAVLTQRKEDLHHLLATFASPPGDL